MNYTDINAKTIDRWVEEGWQWGIPLSHEEYEKAVQGQWEMVLTPHKPVPKAWFYPFNHFESLQGMRILGLAAGGGQQMPIFAAGGADCTVLDYSSRQLESERMVAEREGYAIRIVRADMSKPLPFADESFDLIFHPVSNVYVEDVESIFRECYRILKPGGRLLAGLDNGINFVYNEEETEMVETLPFNPLKNERQRKFILEADCGYQFSHSIEEQIGGQLRAGFLLRDVYQDTNEEGNLHEHGVPSFFATMAEKPAR